MSSLRTKLKEHRHEHEILGFGEGSLGDHLNGEANKHDASEIDVEGTYDRIPGTPTDLETTISSINDVLAEIIDTGGGSEPEDSYNNLIFNFAESSYETYTYTSGKITNITIWTDITQTVKRREFTFSYVGNRITSEALIQYTGLSVELQRVTRIYNYTGPNLTSVSCVETGEGGFPGGGIGDVNDLVFNIARTGYEQYTYDGSLISTIIFWTSEAMETKVREYQFTYDGGNIVSEEVIIQYDETGVENERLTKTFNYVDGLLISVTNVVI